MIRVHSGSTATRTRGCAVRASRARMPMRARLRRRARTSTGTLAPDGDDSRPGTDPSSARATVNGMNLSIGDRVHLLPARTRTPSTPARTTASRTRCRRAAPRAPSRWCRIRSCRADRAPEPDGVVRDGAGPDVQRRRRPRHGGADRVARRRARPGAVRARRRRRGARRLFHSGNQRRHLRRLRHHRLGLHRLERYVSPPHRQGAGSDRARQPVRARPFAYRQPHRDDAVGCRNVVRRQRRDRQSDRHVDLADRGR